MYYQTYLLQVARCKHQISIVFTWGVCNGLEDRIHFIYTSYKLLIIIKYVCKYVMIFLYIYILFNIKCDLNRYFALL